MSLVEMLILALVLSADSFAVSVSCGIRCLSARKFLKVAALLSIAQAIMPFLGWLIGSAFSVFLENLDHWVAFSLLMLIGMKMIWESRKTREDSGFDLRNTRILLLLAIATSIDAFVVGIGFGLLHVNIWLACLIIGVVTFAASMTGGWVGHRSGRLLGNAAELIGGLVLIGLGIKILLEHLNG